MAGPARAVGENTRREYLERINRVTEYLNANPAGDAGLKELARIAGFSEFHFHRVFQAMTGESLFQYRNRIRLSHAAHMLLHRPDLLVTDIAFEMGFSNVSDFERSFKKRYATTPSRYRSGAREAGADKLRASRAPGRRFVNSVEAETRIRKLGALTVAYVACTGLSKSFKNKDVERAYARLYTWSKSKGVADGKMTVLGMYPDNPEITPMAECRYYACITVPKGTGPEGEIGVMDLGSEGRYVTHTFGMRPLFFPRRFFRTMMYLYGDWIPGHGFYPDDKPFLEIYHGSRGRATAMEFCIPIR